MSDTASPRILVVDDNDVNLRLALWVLGSAGYRTSKAADAETALALALADPPDLILLDLQLPGMDGLALARLLKARPETRGIPVVALTAHAMVGDAEKAFAAGCDGYITKPVDTRALPGQVAAHLAKKS